MRTAVLAITVIGWLSSFGALAEAPHGVAGAQTIDVWQAQSLHQHEVLFVDVRSPQVWRMGHIAGAVHLDIRGPFAALAQPQWPRNVPLVFYGDSELSSISALASKLAVGWGYEEVYYFRQGFFAWQLMDLPQSQNRLELDTLSASVQAAPAHCGAAPRGQQSQPGTCP
ncbi:rhodanese-like domain-containing protein [Atopomonas sediminilitoris]|uniref:rhodanese-like domain-containing protein n=1 Tax=Atopomonas sediminilitoris TaxID=2919919 RepID=UPI001F4EBB05|nr:rhodanese-like domain-containing protein [Atopomonas sediminilitoris]MCJ8167921.1 rhodanese-like domain-containing protein [Atopomonas sediminilitoris]